MHTSIAHALYRGEMRQFQPRRQVAEARLERVTVRHGRNAWMRNVMRHATTDPSFAPLARYLEVEKKHEIHTLVGFLHPNVLPDLNAWCAAGYILQPKTFTVTRCDLPAIVAHHTVLRLMQRADIADINQALRWLLPALFYVLLVEPQPPGEDALLPCTSGAVVAIKDKHDADCWVFVTYIDEDKLRPEQRAERDARQRRLTAEMATYSLFNFPPTQEGGRIALT